MLNYIQSEIMRQAKNIRYTVADNAPNNDRDLFNCNSLVIWSGASDLTIFKAPEVNHAFRAIHDNMHLKTGLGLNVAHEIELGRIQASKQSSQLLADLFYIDVALQSEFFGVNGHFPLDQLSFDLAELLKRGYKYE